MIALLTDFGTRDGYVASMKGVIYSISPNAKIVDISHDIRPQNVYEAGFVLWQCYKFFPEGTIFTVVVDPYVGSERKCIALKKDRYIFLAPDNGILSYILQDGAEDIIHLTNTQFFQSKVSNTFHGRDIFASVAAYLENGICVTQIGQYQDTMKTFELGPPAVTEDALTGTVIYVDTFGNIISNLSYSQTIPWLTSHPSFSLFIDEKEVTEIQGLSRAYCDVPVGRTVLHYGSSDLLELALREGSAAEQFKVKIGASVRMSPSR